MSTDAEHPSSVTATPRSMLIGLLALALALRIGLRLGPLDSFVDDAFIFLRYALNLGHGHGLEYNPGDPVYGFSSPLYVVLLGGVAAIVGRGGLESATLVLDLVLWLGGAVLAIDLARRDHRAPLLFVLPALFWFPLVNGSLTGMETTLFVALLLALVALLHRGRNDAAAVVLALVLLTRPEGVVVAIAVIVWAALRRPRPDLPRRGALVGIGLLVGWLAFAAAYYGALLPQSVLSKAGGVQGHLAGSVTGVVQDVAMLAFGVSSRQLDGFATPVRVLLVALALVLVPVVVVDAVRQLRAGAPAAILPLTFVGTWAMYVIGDPVHIWSWYTVPTSLCFWWSVTRQSAELLPVRPRLDRAMVVGAAVVSVASIVIGLPVRRSSDSETVKTMAAVSARVATTAPGARSIMLGDVGVVGFRTDARIIDLSGLVSSEALARDPFGPSYIITIGALIRSQTPDVVVLSLDPLTTGSSVEGTIRRGIFSSVADYEYFRDNYIAIPPDGDRLTFVRRELVSR